MGTGRDFEEMLERGGCGIVGDGEDGRSGFVHDFI